MLCLAGDSEIAMIQTYTKPTSCSYWNRKREVDQ